MPSKRGASRTNKLFQPNVDDIGSRGSLMLMNLMEQEDVRARQLNGKRLLCEIPFGQDDVEQLRKILLPKGIQAWNHPTLAAMMTVGIGIYHYNRGDFWSEFPGLDSLVERSKWGQKFEAFLKDRNSLETFRSVKDEGSHRYVGPILAHGGIPQTCLPDFFSLITHYGDREQSGQDLIEIIKGKSVHVDKPVQRFIKYGGEVVEDFVSRFLALWQCYERGDMGARCNLPDRVVEAFSVWWPKHRPKRNGHFKRMPKPELRIEPAGLGIFLYLPRCDDHPDISLQARWHTLERDWAVTRAHEVPVAPSDTWKITGVGRPYTLEGPTDELPVLFFDPDTGKVIPEPRLRRLPSKVWAVFRGNQQMDPPPSFEEGFAQWPGYCLAVFDLSDKHQLRVGNNTFDVRKSFFHCSVDPIVQGVFSRNDVPVFCDLPGIKWDGKANLSLTIDDKPQGNIDIASDELIALIDKPGDYLIELRGPLGESIHKHFVLIPGLTVRADPPVMWPTKKTVKWHISANAGNIQSKDALPPFIRNGSDLEFKVVYAGYEIYLHAEVLQLSWRLLPQQEGHDWTSEPMSLWIDDLCQNNYPLLECAFGKLAQDIEVMLVARHSTSQLEAKQQRSGAQTSWFFDLRVVRDILEQSGKSEEFELLIRIKNGSELFRGKVLSVRPRWDLRNFSAKWKKSEGRHVIDVSWQENGKSITGRWLAIIPLWEPEKGAVLRHEMSNGRCGHKWELSLSDLRPGRYMVKAVHAPWGCDDWIEAQAAIEQVIDVYPESWTETFCHQHDAVTVDSYLQSLLAHWYRPQLVRLPPMAPSGLVANEIICFLEGLRLAGKLEPLKIPEDGSGSLNIFCANAIATTEAYRAMCDKKIVGIWERVLPSTEIITLELNEQDKEFVREVAFQYTNLNTAAKRIKQQHGQRVLSGALAKWHKNLGKEIPPADEVIFLCEKFSIFEGQGTARVREYEQLKLKYQSREAV